MPYLDHGGVRIYYDAFGAGDETPLVLSHGFGNSTQMWAPNVGALAANRRVITWDLRGHGRSDSPEQQDLYTAEASVADLAALLDEVGATRAVLCGLSLGGYLSLAFYQLLRSGSRLWSFATPVLASAATRPDRTGTTAR